MENITTGSKVSIIMPAYNAADKIETSVDSVLNQTYQNWELLIINDCSKDNTVEVVKKYIEKDDRIILIDLIANLGVAKARNAGIKRANGKYIAFLDSDDYWTSDKLLKQTSFMDENNL